MNFLEQLLGAGDRLGLERRNPANVPATNTTSHLPDIDDPASPLYRQRHGGSIVTGIVDSLKSAVTLPRDVYEGTVDLNSDEAIRRSLDFAGAMNLGSFAAAPGGALGSGMVRAAPENRAGQLQALQGIYEPTTALKARKPLTWEDLEGKTIIATQGDRTMAGQRLLGTERDGLFDSPVHIQGGRDFARAEQAQGPDAAAWASTGSGAKPLNNKVRRLLEAGEDPILAYMPLGPNSSDFTKQSYQVYDQLLRKRGGEGAMEAMAKGMPFDPSVDAMRDYMLGLSGTERSAIFKQKFNTKGRLEASGVDPEEVRQLLRDPGLADANVGDIGYGFMRPDGRLIDAPALPHIDYPYQMGGEYLGEFAPGMITPRSVAFHDTFANNPALHGMDQLKVDHTFKTQLPIQKVDARMVDKLMNLQRLYQQRGQ